LPDIHHRAVDHAIVGQRDFQHHWTGVLRVEERHQINHVGIRRERLVFPIRQARPIDHLIGLALGAADHRLKHRSRLTAGMPQITASIARRSMVRRARSSAEKSCARADAMAQINASAAMTVLLMTASAAKA
jgi:hypothetical protein